MLKPPVMKILIVDDNKNTRRLIRNIMEPYGHQFVESEDGTGAIQSYISELPDCVLMDYEMPGISGITAAKEIISAYPNAKIYMVTMFDDEHLREAALKAGINQFISKENLTDLPNILSVAE